MQLQRDQFYPPNITLEFNIPDTFNLYFRNTNDSISMTRTTKTNPKKAQIFGQPPNIKS